MSRKILLLFIISLFCLPVTSHFAGPAAAQTSSDYDAVPPFVTAGSPPLVMLVMGRNHKLYYEAYNDASDLDGDGDLDVGFNPDIEYYGYFDCAKCYLYNSANERFEPSGVTASGKCGVSGEWSGNFLNYLTMSRMDALRKVLYGGYRSTDTATETVLERAYIPQDGHTWGKEYESIAHDGYDIRDYTPLNLPDAGNRHLFASTSQKDFSDANYRPLLRVLPNNSHRIWEWVAKERPVADNSLVTGGGQYDGYPADHAEYESLVLQFANAAHLQGSGAPANGRIDGDGNPHGSNDYYLTIFAGTLLVTTAGSYEISVDGDDAVEVIIDGNVVAGWYGGHGKCNCTSYSGTINLTAGSHILEFRHQERTGGDNYYLRWKGPDSGGVWEIVPAGHFQDLVQTTYDVQMSGSTITDYVVRVQVGVPSMPESRCKLYPNGSYKPIGILQRHGESEEMFFGLITGSYAKNTSGGVLRKNMGPITDEIDPNTGQITAVNGIIRTIDKFRVIGFTYSGYSYNVNCGWITTRAINAGECRMWGNPIAEMMYECLRYYSGAASPTSDFTYSGSTDDSTLGLPLATWQNPFDPGLSYARCAKPFMLVISDINPSFDSDELPGSYYGSFSGTLGTMNVETLLDQVSLTENISGDYYIGDESGNFDTSCSPKTVTSLGKVRGLCPEEPTKQGSYYSAAVAFYGHNNDVNTGTDGAQQVVSYMVGLSSPLPRIEITIQNQVVTLVPFAKSVGGSSISSTRGNFQPTNTIVDFFVQTIEPTYGKFRINYEDVEQGADHDMDAITIYEYQIVDAAGVPVTEANIEDGVAVDITLTSEYAAGGIIQHSGYIISGSTADGTYLEVRDADTGSGSDPDYFLDTPPGVGPNQGPADTAWDDDTALPLVTTRRFSPDTGAGSAAKLLENPLFYAAKYGGFQDSNNNGVPDLTSEWDEDGNGEPDTYFYVVNPLHLEEKLNQSFASILQRTSSGTAASVISGSRTGEGALYQALFYPSRIDSYGNSLLWSGQLYGLFVDHWGNFREDTNENATLDMIQDKIVSPFFDQTQSRTMVNFQADADGDGTGDGSVTTGELSDMKPIWDASKWLAAAAAQADREYTDTTDVRRIWTWVDQNGDFQVSDDGMADGDETSSSETILFDPSLTTNRQIIAPYIMARALLKTNLTGDNNDLEFTAVNPGKDGENIRISYVDPGSANQSLFVTVTGNDISVHLATNASGNITTTAVDVLAAGASDAGARALVSASLPEDDPGQGVVTAMSFQNLSFENGARKLMEYVIGQDKDHWRKRDIEVEGVGVQTWKMGDIIYSTPTVVGQPSESYDLIYGDDSYLNYRKAFADRRQVLYVGTNDGFLHAINAGFWDRASLTFTKTQQTYLWEWNVAAGEYQVDTGQYDSQAEWDLGAEIWAFIPQSILPHLQWLKEREYPHVYMVDLKPRPIDVKFADDRWRTIIICGLRLGGKDISHTDDFSYGTETSTETRTFYSEFFALDVTDPEEPPKLLWSFSTAELGLTTSFPTVVRVDDSWFIILGSGPRGGQAYSGESDQNGRIYILNAETGAMARTTPFVLSESVSFMADPVAVDMDLTATQVDIGGGELEVRWSNELVYIGSTSGSPGAWSGKMYRIKLTDSNGDPDSDPNNWTLSTLVSADGPISSAANVTRDIAGNVWVFFGAGRFWTVGDKAVCLAECEPPNEGSAACLACQEQSRRWFFGVKEPRYASGPHSGELNYSEVSKSDLLDTSGYEIYEGGYVDTNGDGTVDMEYPELLAEISDHDGWYFQFEQNGERSLYQPVVLGGIVTFTSYIPSTDICEFEGQSNLYAMYYLGGTAYSESVIGTGGGSIEVSAPGGGTETKQKIKKSISLGTGVGTAPTFHIGAESKVMIQSSTGAIISVTEKTANQVKSGLKAWKEEF